MFLNFLPFSIFLNRMKVLSAAVARTPQAGPFVRNVGIHAGVDLRHKGNRAPPLKIMHFNENPRKSNKNSIKINRFRKDGWLGQGIWQAKSPKILFSKNIFLENLGNLRKSSRLLLGPAPASSGELGPARPSSGPQKIHFWTLT